MRVPERSEQGASQPAFASAVRLLSGKRLTRAQLVQKLRDRGFAPDAIETAVSRCEEKRYIDDRTFAELYVKSVLERKPVGPMRLLRDLLRHGIDQSVARAAIGDVDDDEEQRIERALRKLEIMRPEDRFDQLAKRLQRMGYGPPAIARALRRRAASGMALDELEELT